MRASGLTPSNLGPGLWLGAFSFAVMVLFVPGLSAPATTPRWALLAAVVPAVAMFTECRRWTISHFLGILCISYAALSLLWTPNIWDGLRGMSELAILAGLFHIGAAAPSLRPVYVGAALGLSVSSLLAVMQLFGLELVDRIEGPTGMGAGLFMNRNYLGEPAALVLIGLIGHRLWWAVPLVLPAILLPTARGALLGLGVAGGVWLWGRSRVAAAVIILVIFCAASVAAYVGVNASFPDRLTIWAATLDGMTWFGNGIGSFFTTFPSHAPGWDFLISRPVHAHNDWLELVYELGLPAAVLLAASSVLLFSQSCAKPECLILIALITEACLGFPLHFPATLFLGGLVAGQFCRDGPRLCDVLERGGMALCTGLERVAASLGARPTRARRSGALSPRPPA